MDVWKRAIDQRAEHVVATLVRRALVVAAEHNVGEIQFLQIDIHAGAPQLLGTGSGQIAELADVSRRHHDDFLALVAGFRQSPLDGGIIARAAQLLDAGIGGERGAGAK
jgi:hypothetical protein